MQHLRAPTHPFIHALAPYARAHTAPHTLLQDGRARDPRLFHTVRQIQLQIFPVSEGKQIPTHHIYVQPHTHTPQHTYHPSFRKASLRQIFLKSNNYVNGRYLSDCDVRVRVRVRVRVHVRVHVHNIYLRIWTCGYMRCVE